MKRSFFSDCSRSLKAKTFNAAYEATIFNRSKKAEK